MARGVSGEGGARGGRDPMAGGRSAVGGMGRDSRNSYGDNRFGRFTGGIASLALAPRPKPMMPNQMGRPTGPQVPYLMQSQVPAAQLSIPGGSPYGLNLPSYGYFGLPGQRRPGQSAILGGI